MPIIGYFKTVLCLSEHGEIIQRRIEDSGNFQIIEPILEKNKIVFPEIGVFDYEITETGSYHISNNKKFLCCSNNLETVTWDRDEAKEWETFWVVANANCHDQIFHYLKDYFIKDYEYGYISEALKKVNHLRKIFPNSEYIKRKENLIQRSCILNGEIKVIINCPLNTMFEGEWLHEILPFMRQYEHIKMESASEIRNKNIVVIDNLLDDKKLTQYKQLYYNNNVLLIHLSDEYFRDDYRCYEYCNVVWRNLWNPVLARYRNVKFFPLGYKKGFKKNTENIEIKNKKYIWFFAGDIKKSNRQLMYDNIIKIQGGCCHLTAYFNSPDGLGVEDYRKYMENSIFVPCPAGNVHLDSFRIYEALEAGCIPIIENGRGLDCFRPYLGENPILMISDWNNIEEMIKNIMQKGDVESLSRECSEWWKKHKLDIQKRIEKDFNNINITNINGSGFCDLDSTSFI